MLYHVAVFLAALVLVGGYYFMSRRLLPFASSLTKRQLTIETLLVIAVGSLLLGLGLRLAQ